jgi:hypothetical protein
VDDLEPNPVPDPPADILQEVRSVAGGHPTVDLAVLNDVLDTWWAAHFPGSPVARNTAAWNHANAAFGALKALISAL